MTTAQYNLKADKRVLMGKKVKQLRSQGMTPANISGKIKEPVAITVPTKEFIKIYNDAGETGVVYVTVEGEKSARPTLIETVDYDRMAKKILHVSFRQVDLKEKVTAMVPVELVGELTLTDASVNQMIQEIEVEALPTDFPEAFTIDLAKFTEIGQEITVKQLDYDASKLTLSAEPDDIVVQVQELQQMAEEPAAEAAPAEGAEGEAAATPAEGGEAASAAEEKKEE